MSTNHLMMRRITAVLTAVVVSLLSYNFLFAGSSRLVRSIGAERGQNPTRLLENLALTADQCEANFPGLTKDISRAVAQGPFKLPKYDNGYYGDLQGRIKNGKLYMITVSDDISRNMIEHRTATLNQLYRAVVTSPDPLPDTYFSLSTHDNPREDSWVYSRPTAPWKQKNYWLMPPFSLWAWNSPLIGTMDEVLSRIDRVEAEVPKFTDKIDRAVWRGTTHFNPIDNTRLRNNLYLLAKDKPWANVAQLSYPHVGKDATGLSMEDHCRYRYVIYTEGVTYSGRLPYHQACASIMITTPLLHHTYSTQHLRPLFSSSLELNQANFSTEPPVMKPLAAAHSEPDDSWPRSYSPAEANVIFVAPDWSDLEAVIQWLRDHEAAAAGIASRLRHDFVNGGYLSPAAEACYWRALIRGWASVAQPDIGKEKGQWSEDEGVRFEEYVLRGDLKDTSLGKGG